MNHIDFDAAFRALTDHAPFPWQQALYRRFMADDIPWSCNLPTGLGKTSVIAVWLIALAARGGTLPRRLVYVVNRRTVVDQSTREAEKMRAHLTAAGLHEALKALCAVPSDPPLAISTLRGQYADNRAWSADPACPAIIVGTVDMIGSRLLFAGYGVGFRMKPLHAGFLGQDVLLVHDEAHLEPAFQELLVAIQREQERCKEFGTFRVMELSATSRGGGTAFELTEAERTPPRDRPEPPALPLHHVWRRQAATKTIHLHENQDANKLADELADLALAHKDSQRAVLVFVRRVEDVDRICKKLPGGAVQQLTGTLRGLERDRMADPRRETGCPIFARFLRPPAANAPPTERWKITPRPSTVYLVCTSAGEVGVNISADHLVCDLSTFDSMAQRFGRVNRFGERDDTRIDIVCPHEFDTEDAYAQRLKRTRALLVTLNGDGSPAALGRLDADARRAAFAPAPNVLPVSDILFDAWALTTIRERLPGRPPVEQYLHGEAAWEPPQTQLAWRAEVGVLTGDLLQRYRPADLLERYPLKPHELLRDRSDRVFKHLAVLARRRPNDLAWLIDDDTVEVVPLTELAVKDAKDRLSHRTVLLSPATGGLMGGLLDGSSCSADDVADEWFRDDEQATRRRCREWSDEATPPRKAGMRLVLEIDTSTGDEDEEDDNVSAISASTDGETTTRRGRYWRWYVRPMSADDDGSRLAQEPVTWDDHTRQVREITAKIVAALRLPTELQHALILAAELHDLGKMRVAWQRSIGNPKPNDWHAKSGKGWKPVGLTSYRHEFGSLLDALSLPALQQWQGSPELRDLVLHLVAAHHGRARPHFPAEEAFDPEPKGARVEDVSADVPQRYARLQQRYGRWGLAYLESLLRAADHAASAQPTREGTT